MNEIERMMLLGQMASDDYEKNPPDIDEWIRALEGCAELYKKAVEHLKSDPPKFGEAVRALVVSVQTGDEIREQIALAFVLSGQATDLMLSHIRKEFEEKEDD